jgi:hypothetical protein
VKKGSTCHFESAVAGAALSRAVVAMAVVAYVGRSYSKGLSAMVWFKRGSGHDTWSKVDTLPAQIGVNLQPMGTWRTRLQAWGGWQFQVAER